MSYKKTVAEIPHGAVPSSNSDFSIAPRAENLSIVHRGGVDVYTIYKIFVQKCNVLATDPVESDKIFLY